ncbi:Na(+)/citrate cotransporter-like [Liolophura sinensis]|uniref:Na(+)/citrate cotransporter-like n=1 Tax=Liolophura sinensis TaxID=3198878 RepID=UPI0031595B30
MLQAGKCAYATLMMAVFWILEVFPISVTSLLPVVLFPILGILSARDVCAQYVKDSTFIVLGIFCVAAGVERWNLHKRLALRILLIFGTKPQWLMLSLLVCNVFLAMFTAVFRLILGLLVCNVFLTMCTSVFRLILGLLVCNVFLTMCTSVFRLILVLLVDAGPVGVLCVSHYVYLCIQVDVGLILGLLVCNVFLTMCTSVFRLILGLLVDVGPVGVQCVSHYVYLCVQVDVGLILGLLVCNVFLSMWMSAGVAVMMIPIMKTLVDKLNEAEISSPDIEMSDIPEEVSPNGTEDTKSSLDRNTDPHGAESSSTQSRSASDTNAELYKALSLCIAYGTSLGSTATLTGGPVNLVMQGLADQFFERYGLTSGVTFGNWFVYAFPMVVIITLLTWLWFIVLFLKCRGCIRRGHNPDARAEAEERAMKHIRQEYADMGSITYPEIIVLTDLVILILLYITKDLYLAPGWDSVFKKGYVGSSAPTILAAMVLFVIPASSPREFINKREFTPIITWSDVTKTVPWGVIWLLGGGFALVLASQRSGLSALIGGQFSVFSGLEPWVMTLILSAITAFLTEFTSNAATITMLVPIVGELAIQLNLHPMSLIFPITMAGKFAFMTPIASPPNAIVFSMGALKIRDMVIAGFVVNLICLLVMNVGSQTWGRAYFGWDVFPEALRVNGTLTDTTENHTLIGQTA